MLAAAALTLLRAMMVSSCAFSVKPWMIKISLPYIGTTLNGLLRKYYLNLRSSVNKDEVFKIRKLCQYSYHGSNRGHVSVV